MSSPGTRAPASLEREAEDRLEAAYKPAELLERLGWPGQPDEISQSLPLDMHGMLRATSEPDLTVSCPPLSSPEDLRRTLHSMLERATKPFGLGLITTPTAEPELLTLIARTRQALPVMRVMGDGESATDPRRSVVVESATDFRRSVVVEAGCVMRHGWSEVFRSRPSQEWARWPLGPAPVVELDDRRLRESLAARSSVQMAIAYVLPGLPQGGSGGSHSIFLEALALASLGVQVSVCIERWAAERARLTYPEASDLIAPWDSADELRGALSEVDVAIATEHPAVAQVARALRSSSTTRPVYYVQDYEPLFNPRGSSRADRALLSYRALPGMAHVAKTHWLCNVIAALEGVPVYKIEPSLDRRLYHARGRAPMQPDRLRVAAMIRPRTPRRRPFQTLRVLADLSDEHGREVEIATFGCSAGELEELNPSKRLLAGHHGVLTRRQVAHLFRRSDAFIDLSTYQAFGRSGLEAMACGVVPILPAVGGVYEYARPDVNALLQEHHSEVTAHVEKLIEDRKLLTAMQDSAIDTAAQYTALRSAISTYELLAAVAHRG